MSRISTHTQMLKICGVIADRGTCGRLQVGCVIALENRIISTGYNGPLKGLPHCNETICNLSNPCTRAIHAEMNAIMFAAKVGIKLQGATLYCTNQPCLQCATHILQTGINKVVYQYPYRDNSGLELLKSFKVETLQHEPTEDSKN